MQRWLHLLLWERSGGITGLRRQVKYLLVDTPVFKMHYVADFVYTENGETITEDFKGFLTEDYKTKRNLMRDVHGITIRETTR